MTGDERVGLTATSAAAQQTVELFEERLHRLLAAANRPQFVAIDGRSGTGKSTLAAAVAARMAAQDESGSLTVIDGDDFYSGGSAATWDGRTAAEKADRVIDWRRQREVLEQLHNEGVASWHAFDWDAENWDGPTAPLATGPTHTRVSRVTVLEGAYSCRPELHDQFDLLVLLQAPDEVRRQRLRDREGAEYHADWEARWSTAEDYYFTAVMPPERFDLVLDG